MQFDPITEWANQGEIAGRATYDDPRSVERWSRDPKFEAEEAPDR